MKALCGAEDVRDSPTIPLSIHLHLVLFPLLPLLFAALPANEDPQWVELRHRTCLLRKVCTGQMKLFETTTGDVVQELLIPSGDALDASGELR